MPKRKAKAKPVSETPAAPPLAALLETVRGKLPALFKAIDSAEDDFDTSGLKAKQ
jgi:hypothetical protein